MYEPLRTRMNELRDLAGVIGLATWDMETYLPKKAEAARASQLSTLQGLYHQRLVDPQLGDWLAKPDAQSDDERAMVRILTNERNRAVKVPERLVKALAEAQSHAISAWREGRAQKSFAPFQPHLEGLLALRREQADAWGHDGERYDALLEAYEPGMRVARLMPVLDQLASKLKPLVDTLTSLPPAPNVLRGKHFDLDAQWRFTMQLLPAMGFDLDAGRQDKSVHPFTGGTHMTDVRLTTRLFEDTPFPAIFGTIHEGGHGLYEQGFDPAHARTTLGQAPSMGLHESQSRLWENIVGRSPAFWTHFFPRLRREFPVQLGGVSFEGFVREVNRVEKSFIRVEADELTYNLHIVLRTELELGLMRGTLSTKDVADAWNERTKQLLGLDVPSPELGVLQDIHWAWGEFGYFPTYTLGNLYGASLWKALVRDVPKVEASIAAGDLSPVTTWLRTHIHREGWRYDAEALVQRVTGRGLNDEDFLGHLKAKYGALHGLSF
jgi:carboxypeptidase Taq